MIDRMDEALEFPLPSRDERKAIIALYLEQYITQASTATAGGRAVGLRGRISAFFRGQKVAADAIRCRGCAQPCVLGPLSRSEGFVRMCGRTWQGGTVND